MQGRCHSEHDTLDDFTLMGQRSPAHIPVLGRLVNLDSNLYLEKQPLDLFYIYLVTVLSNIYKITTKKILKCANYSQEFSAKKNITGDEKIKPLLFSS